MVRLGPAFGFLSVLALATASPVKRQDSTAASSTAADTAASTAADTAASTATDTAASTGTDTAAATTSAASGTDAATSSAGGPQTTVTAFVPSNGGPPNATLYAVTGANETYLVGLEYATATDSAGATTTAVLEDIFVVSEDELDLYIFDTEGNALEATECDISTDGTTATCNGIVIDLVDQAIGVFANITVSGASSGIPAYLPTGTADPAGISAASNAPARISSFTAIGGVSASTVTAGTATLTSQDSISPTILPGASGDTSAASALSSGTEGTVAESTGTDAAATSTDTAATSTATEALPTDTAGAASSAVPATA